MAYISETLTWEDTRDELLAYLDTTCPDVKLQLQFEAAVSLCEEYLNNPFLDEDDEDEDLPAGVKIGVFEWVRKRIEAPVCGVISEKVGDLQANYSVTLLAGDKDIMDRYWTPWRLSPGT